MSINGIGRILSDIEDRLREGGHSEKTISGFRARSLARCAMALPFTSIDRRLELADSALRTASDNLEKPMVSNTAFEDEPKSPMWVTCSACNHRWIGLYLPMPISDAAKAMKRLTCPRCVCTKIFAGVGAIGHD